MDALLSRRTTSLCLLDGFRAHADGRPVVLPAAGQRLLALLVLRGELDRHEAAGVLWPDDTQARASANLRTALWRTASVLPEALDAGRRELLLLDPRVRVDVHLLEETALRLASGDLGAVDPVLPFREGELLRGWDEDWVAPERERLRQAQLHVLTDAARALAALGRLGAAVDTAHRALRLEPLREPTHRLLVELHLAAGDPGEAVRQAALCQRVLREELGLPVTEQMHDLLARVRGERELVAR